MLSWHVLRQRGCILGQRPDCGVVKDHCGRQLHRQDPACDTFVNFGLSACLSDDNLTFFRVAADHDHG